ncbi:MAG: hypothetical protein QM714_11805 [Nocardioides sp.]|uniref:hypothetical protein n=1 Tax=Nocardioides sp. TaxID=35761 RepID=UPI0039E6A910
MTDTDALQGRRRRARWLTGFGLALCLIASIGWVEFGAAARADAAPVYVLMLAAGFVGGLVWCLQLHIAVPRQPKKDEVVAGRSLVLTLGLLAGAAGVGATRVLGDQGMTFLFALAAGFAVPVVGRGLLELVRAYWPAPARKDPS